MVALAVLTIQRCIRISFLLYIKMIVVRKQRLATTTPISAYVMPPQLVNVLGMSLLT